MSEDFIEKQKFQKMTNHELIILALEQLRDSSYSPERREQCQRVIEEMKNESKGNG